MTYFKNFILAFFICFSTNIGFSQEPTRCATDEIHQLHMDTDEEYKRSYLNLLKSIESNTSSEPASSHEVYTIPIVVHIMHNGEVIGEGSNVSDEVIYNAIEALNNDFKGEPLFPALGGGADFYNEPQDANIEFCFATVDPNNNPTNGITRTNVTETIPSYATSGVVTLNTFDPAYESVVKALSTWDPSEYCNIWVVYKTNGAASPLGYAYLPPNSVPGDGIVVHHRVFGYGEDYLMSSFNQNKTITHEMGHYLGLLHTFYNTNSCGPESNCNGQGDRLCDTPPTTGSSGCGPVSCYETMTENFMDYSADRCMDRFSPDGVTRMRNKLLQWRSDLLDNGNCVILDGTNVGVSSLSVPTILGSCGESITNASFTLNNTCLDTITSVTLNYQVDEGTPVNTTWNGEIVPLGFEVVTLPPISVPYGIHTITLWSTNPNGVEDSFAGNDTTSLTFNNEPGTTVDLEIILDGLPYGFSWDLINTDTEELVDDGGPYDNELACTNIEFQYCLPNGNYDLILSDIFGNGLHYYCANLGQSGTVSLINSNDTLAFAWGNWGSTSNNPFTLGSSEVPSDLCLNLSDNTQYNGSFSRDSDLEGSLVASYPNNEYDVTLTANNYYTSWTGTTDLGVSGGLVFLNETLYKDYSPFNLISGIWSVGETVRIMLELTYDTPVITNGVAVPSETGGITWGTCD